MAKNKNIIAIISDKYFRPENKTSIIKRDGRPIIVEIEPIDLVRIRFMGNDKAELRSRMISNGLRITGSGLFLSSSKKGESGSPKWIQRNKKTGPKMIRKQTIPIQDTLKKSDFERHFDINKIAKIAALIRNEYLIPPAKHKSVVRIKIFFLEKISFFVIIKKKQSVVQRIPVS